MQRRSIGGAAVLATTLVLVCGCGSSSSSSSSASSSAATSTGTSSSSTSTSASQSGNQTAQFKAAIMPVLGQFKSASQATGAEIQKAGRQTNTQVAAGFDQLVGPWQSGLDRLKSLSPPPQFRASVNHLQSQIASVVSDVKAVAAAARKNDAGRSSVAARNMVRDIVAAKATSTKITARLGTS